MRHINYDPSRLALPDGWTDRVQGLQTQLLAETDAKERAELIDSNDDVWKAIKQELAKLFNFKCWYTESPQCGTDVDVDHYRPKKRVAELSDKDNPHPGYWWLAFKLENYRYSCIVANRRRRDVETDKVGGKADHFPIWKEDKRAWTPDCDCDEEQPILLDPCNATDVTLLTFKEDGEAMPRWGVDQKYMNMRAAISIEYYSLNHSEFVNARIDLRERMQRHINSAKRSFKKLFDETCDATHEKAYEDAIVELTNMCKITAPFSRFCVTYLSKFKHEDWMAGMDL